MKWLHIIGIMLPISSQILLSIATTIKHNYIVSSGQSLGPYHNHFKTVTAQTYAAHFPRKFNAVLDSDHTKISGHPEGQFSITLHCV